MQSVADSLVLQLGDTCADELLVRGLLGEKSGILFRDGFGLLTEGTSFATRAPLTDDAVFDLFFIPVMGILVDGADVHDAHMHGPIG
ncbi:hypothetical protein CXR34_08110 [Microbacterium hominis]|uniref:Uncharacterized protein n=1 Tax=Microbacterium hominis TaxID=162426 RepID=A0A2K9DM29_9MICO|nr:hypothetical protein CXR34_08110 [Microbacterium hominis]